MSGVSEQDLALDYPGNYNFVCLAVSIGIMIYFVSLKMLFGSFSIFRVLKDYKQRRLVDQRYLQLFKTRDDLCYHISWARARGDFDEAKNMVKDLLNVEKVGWCNK